MVTLGPPLVACLASTHLVRKALALGELAVGLDHHDRVVVLDGDLDVPEVVLLEEGRLPMLPGLTRTAAQPASMAANTYSGWKWTSVRVVVVDCTDTGAPPPTGPGPAWIRRGARRGATGRAGTSGTPSGTGTVAVIPCSR
jgi:hypothetical protein